MFARPLVAVIFIGAVSFHGVSQNRETKKYPRVNFAKVVDSEYDTLFFFGTVKTIYKCPPCPEGAHCKPCIGDHVEVTNGSPDLNFRVFTHQLSLFQVDRTYEFLVRFRSAIHRKENIELISAKKRK